MPGQIVWNAVPDYEFTDSPFIPGEVQDLLENGQFNHEIEVIIGSNKVQFHLLHQILKLFPFFVHFYYVLKSCKCWNKATFEGNKL